MSAVEPDFSTQLLDRFLVIAHSYDLEPSILVTKKDLASENEIEQINAWLKFMKKLVTIRNFRSIRVNKKLWQHGLKGSLY